MLQKIDRCGISAMPDWKAWAVNVIYLVGRQKLYATEFFDSKLFRSPQSQVTRQSGSQGQGIT